MIIEFNKFTMTINDNLVIYVAIMIISYIILFLQRFTVLYSMYDLY